jgi:hypothetical protein
MDLVIYVILFMTHYTRRPVLSRNLELGPRPVGAPLNMTVPMENNDMSSFIAIKLDIMTPGSTK